MNYKVKAIIFSKSDEAVLVKPEGKVLWSLPGGGERPNEGEKRCLERELWQELHLAKKYIFKMEFLCGYSVKGRTEAGIYLVKCKLPKHLEGHSEIRKVRLFRHPRMCNLTDLTRYAFDRYYEMKD